MKSSDCEPDQGPSARRQRWERWFLWWMEHRLLAGILAALVIGLGLYVAPWGQGVLRGTRDPIAVDAIPDMGENQQIVFTTWPGHSPRDIEDQISYPLTSLLLSTPGVRSVRSSSAFGFSTIYVIFDDEVEFYWARSRLSETLSALPEHLLPKDVMPRLGPDATALGQVFWYTLQGQDEDGEPTGGWALDELRTVQDWTIRPALASVPGVSEVASIGGYVREYQVNVDPEALRAHGVTLAQVADAVRSSNRDGGARTMELNRVEYVVRGLGRLRGIEDLEKTAVVTRDHRPIRIRDLAKVQLGPQFRRGALDDAGAPAVGGVVVARYRENPAQVIAQIKAKLTQIQGGLPKKMLDDGTLSQLRVVPFYDRSELIEQTLDTISRALYQGFLVTVVVVVVMLGSFRAASLISLMLPLGVAGAFVAMKGAGVQANVMALGGIAIAIGTMADIGIIFVEKIWRALDRKDTSQARGPVIASAAAQVAPAVLTSVLTTLVSFLPVLGLSSSELRLFMPLVLTKSFGMAAALLVALVLVPCAALGFRQLRAPSSNDHPPRRAHYGWLLVGGAALWIGGFPGGAGLILMGSCFLLVPIWSSGFAAQIDRWWKGACALILTMALAQSWMPLGASAGLGANAVAVALIMGLWLGLLWWFERNYGRLLLWILDRRRLFLAVTAAFCAFGALAWLGVRPLLQSLPDTMVQSRPAQAIERTFPGLGKDYLPSFDEGAFLYMPTTMPHASMRETLEALAQIDAAIAAIPEVDRVVGKLGRAESALDPAPISMIETLITYHPEYSEGPDGEMRRNWRDEIRTSRDIWNEIAQVAQRPGLTSAPVLMPMSARIVMLQSGMRAPLGIRIQGPSLSAIETFSNHLQALLKEVPALNAPSVFAEQVVAKPYLEIEIDRDAIGRYGLSVADLQETLEVAMGGKPQSQLILGRERYPVRVRYMRETRDSVQALQNLVVPISEREQVPLSALAKIRYHRGPAVIKSEDAFLTSYVIFDKKPGHSLVQAVNDARQLIQSEIADGTLVVPQGVHFEFAGSYRQQVESEERLMLLFPLAGLVVLAILYWQFRRISTCLMVLSSVVVAMAGGFVLLWLYGQPWFLNLDIFGVSLRSFFSVGTVNLSVSVWVGFIALVGLATDDAVVMVTHLEERFAPGPACSLQEVRARVQLAGARRVRACLMTTATTVLALLPVVCSSGRGAELMRSMALPCVGGMTFELLTLFVVPVLYSAMRERETTKLKTIGSSEED